MMINNNHLSFFSYLVIAEIHTPLHTIKGMLSRMIFDTSLSLCLYCKYHCIEPSLENLTDLCVHSQPFHCYPALIVCVIFMVPYIALVHDVDKITLEKPEHICCHKPIPVNGGWHL